MPRLSLAFFTAAAFCGLGGMIWGATMAQSQDFQLAPAHAHLNLVGWTTLSIMGTFYALAGEKASARLGWINFALSTLGVAVIVPALVKLLLGDHSAEPIVIAGTAITILGMVTFVVSVLSLWLKPKAA